MSIRDFYLKFMGNEENVLLGSLRRLLLIEEPLQVGGGSGGPASDWVAWQSSTECEAVAGA
ncbi:MAG: hypothetical protein QOJ16_3232 [Acidobacteriota bacterium]|jgi:hypothetical protein|nr:hypothetical protein [Acidobacteriota bacterium]